MSEDNKISNNLTAGPRVLMVDDEESVLFALKLLMEAIGYKVKTFLSGKEAIQELKSNTDYDYFLCDLKMPEMDGLQVLKAVKELLPELPAVLMSAHATDEEIAKAQELGIVGFLSKPFTPEELQGVLK